MIGHRLKSAIRGLALEEGFSAVGFALATDLGERAGLESWLARRYHGTMAWLARDPARRRDPRRVRPGTRTVVSLAVNYDHPARHEPTPGAGRISRYAWGGDYHREIGRQLRRLSARLVAARSGIDVHPYVDTGPVLEKAWAHAAGVGWVGKHANVIRRGHGSWFFLAEILLDVELEPDPPATDHCGTCTRCIDACPTGAIVAPTVVDSRRCISYLTIEHRGPIPRELAHGDGRLDLRLRRLPGRLPLEQVCAAERRSCLCAASGACRPHVSPIWRGWGRKSSPTARAVPTCAAPRYAGFLRNVMVALGNATTGDAGPALRLGLEHREPLVRAHAAWGLERRGERADRALLARRAASEEDAAARAEIEMALERVSGAVARRNDP